jgi:hypothetical protein
VSRAYGMHGRGEKCVHGFGRKVRLKDQGVDGRMGSKWTLGRLAWGMEWILLAQGRDRWRAVVNAVMNLRVLASRN